METGIVQGKDISFNRKALESKKTRMLVLSHTDKKDRLKQRDSGLNQVLCKIAKDNSITLAIDLSELKNKEKKEKAIILSRMLQNIRLIKKFKNKFKLLNPGNKQQAFSLLLTLGMPTSQAKISLE
jgi:RNase P/RNase MRP subunit p30